MARPVRPVLRTGPTSVLLRRPFLHPGLPHGGNRRRRRKPRCAPPFPIASGVLDKRRCAPAFSTASGVLDILIYSRSSSPFSLTPEFIFFLLCSTIVRVWATHVRRPNPRAPLHGSQIHRTRSSSTSLAFLSTPPSRSPSTRLPGIKDSLVAGQ